MKYSTTKKPLVCMMTQSTCYKGTKKMTVKGILWHSTGANNPEIRRYVQPDDKASNRDELLRIIGKNQYGNDWNHQDIEAGLNAWIGELADGSVATVQTLEWDMRPWGCGSGSKGSCNDGWIQFEICEDGLSDKTYFNKVYTEACELTAYLCKTFNIDPNGVVDFKGVKVPTILCHADSHSLGLGSNHGDVLHWFKKHGKTMDDVRKDVAKLIGTVAASAKPAAEAKYRVRKTWADANSQIGAFADLANAKAACDKAGSAYKVFDMNGKVVYPVQQTAQPAAIKVGSAVKLLSGAVYSTGEAVPKWVLNSKLYAREFRSNGDVVVSTQKSGAVTGVVPARFVVPYSTTTAAAGFTPYVVRVTADVLNVRSGAGTNYGVVTQIYQNEAYTIIDEKNGFGRLKSGAGWVSLQYVKKV